ncbi:tRNA sulfurtransferase [Halobacterium sp. MBLA0001]|uniref:tRNA sulfurtransferase n=1 Tax=Halobacterium TaxID=2239 RepID=UPI00196320BC|nr:MULTISPECIES: tRNA sulfurtransferase [Halobacterium]MCF2165153.1 tRNA sulfurtransferase [Halobacterium salinarum]MCF2168038.1 tRNA sulfurtransferase [Halobacterium salinarum]MDL0133461.1 tRNA sulfurtransferase [Halobacterium salinarum]QRY23693.1 tRNA sulfurtransferase [Halobacterium sp. GSL-19]
MLPPGADSVVVRHGDVGVKSSHVQSDMERTLRDNVAAMLADRGVPGDVEREWGRVLVRSPAAGRAADAAADTFGVVSASPAVSVAPDLDAISDALAAAARAHYDGGAFAVDARRAGTHDFDSHDVNRVGGDAVWAAVEDDFQPVVDLDDPDITFFVEVRDAEAFVFLTHRDGPGGMPLGTQQPLVALVSGGIDSPVAAWEAMRRGAPVIPLYLALGDYGGPDHRARAEAAVRTLDDYAPNHDLSLRVAPAGDAIDRLAAATGRTRMLSFRRFMYRVAEHVAEHAGAAGIVTGEAVGQKSSQTTANLGVVDRATTLPVHRPLLTWDKQRITAAARSIDTFRDSSLDVGCNRLAPRQPLTAAPIESVRADEPDALFEWARTVAADTGPVEVAVA